LQLQRQSARAADDCGGKASLPRQKQRIVLSVLQLVV
jgi:hypothetical protein